ncbi:glycosyl transferase 4-like domain protein [Mycobacterium xenopi 4042]|uniref:Glycosyl transferase 4-like domain protein n=1 Tax=Mycobacterium xenopi 4042 TaxID=1299334 RepID=X7ZB52_MYCXE|nr:glycosyl transferase 4-like domain protein [Mycobacterium xenopi 4042]
MSAVLLLCWRDTGHPQGGGSEAYLQRIGAQLAATGVDVTLRTARYPGAPRREVVDGVRVNRAGDGIRYTSGRCWRWPQPGWGSGRCDGCGPTW